MYIEHHIQLSRNNLIHSGFQEFFGEGKEFQQGRTCKVGRRVKGRGRSTPEAEESSLSRDDY